MTPKEARDKLEKAIQTLVGDMGAGTVFKAPLGQDDANAADLSIRGTVQHLDEPVQVGAQAIGQELQAVQVSIECRSGISAPGKAENAAELFGTELPPLLNPDFTLYIKRFVTPPLPAIGDAAPTHYNMSVFWDGYYQLT